jgi:hypothetical protein
LSITKKIIIATFTPLFLAKLAIQLYPSHTLHRPSPPIQALLWTPHAPKPT